MKNSCKFFLAFALIAGASAGFAADVNAIHPGFWIQNNSSKMIVLDTTDQYKPAPGDDFSSAMHVDALSRANFQIAQHAEQDYIMYNFADKTGNCFIQFDSSAGAPQIAAVIQQGNAKCTREGNVIVMDTLLG